MSLRENWTKLKCPGPGHKVINLLLWKYLWRPEWVRLEPRRSEEVKRKMIGRKSSDKSCYIFRHLVTCLWIFQCLGRMRWVQGKTEVDIKMIPQTSREFGQLLWEPGPSLKERKSLDSIREVLKTESQEISL